MRDHYLAITKHLFYVDAPSLFRLERWHFWVISSQAIGDGHGFAASAYTLQPSFWLGQFGDVFRLSNCKSHDK
jgi:hypothetical protein